MKRSEINQLLREAKTFIAQHQFYPPPFAFWTPEDWAQKGHEADEIRDNLLGWDITDFGSGDFGRIGLAIITIRNGNYHDPRYIKPYAEKLLIVREEQVTPMHYHALKMEDIINRGGGNLMIQLYNSTEDNQLAKTSVTISLDGVVRTVDAGTTLRLTPGESISLPSRLFHKFYGEKGCGTVLVGEVSKVNDDKTDNLFYDGVGRFPQIEEDEQPIHYLCTEYPRAR